MTIEPGYPVTLVHPQHRSATIATGNMLSSPEQFPNVTVNGAQHEAEYRAKGYLRFGEPQAEGWVRVFRGSTDEPGGGVAVIHSEQRLCGV